MKSSGSFTRWLTGGVAIVALTLATAAQAAAGKAVVRSVRGTASYSDTSGDWKPLKVGKVLHAGNSVKTGIASQVDLFLDENGPIVRVTSDTTLGLDKLDLETSGPETVIETQLDLRQGTIQGVVKKLAAASRYEVRTPNAVAAIRGTEYQISADSVMHVREGNVRVAYTNPVTRRISTHEVNAGQTFVPPADPAQPNVTPTVRPTRPDDPVLPPIGPGGGTPVIDGQLVVVVPVPEPFVSPTTEEERKETKAAPTPVILNPDRPE